MTFSKYIIHHLDLSADIEPLDDVRYPDRYFVFWFRTIPLGDLYCSFRDPFPSPEFWRECIRAIFPALAHYSRQYGCQQAASDELAPDPAVIRKECQRILEGIHPTPSATSDVSVVICTRDRATYLERCLACLRDQHTGAAEIIVVDNAPTSDDTLKISEAFGVRYIREDIPGLDVARNRGARAARGTIVAYVDDDTAPDKYWIYRVSETFRNPAIAAMTGLVIAASLETEAEVIFEKFWPFNRGYLGRLYDNEFFQSFLSEGPPVWEIGAGANMAFRRDIFEKIGYFDERLDAGAAGCSGDSELWYRTLACGYSILYNPLAVVRHSHRPSIPGLRRQLYSYMRGFTVAILIQYQRFGHRGNLQHLFRVLTNYLRQIRRGFPRYRSHYKTLFPEVMGFLSGFIYFFRHRNTDPKIFGNDVL